MNIKIKAKLKGYTKAKEPVKKILESSDEFNTYVPNEQELVSVVNVAGYENLYLGDGVHTVSYLTLGANGLKTLQGTQFLFYENGETTQSSVNTKRFLIDRNNHDTTSGSTFYSGGIKNSTGNYYIAQPSCITSYGNRKYTEQITYDKDENKLYIGGTEFVIPVQLPYVVFAESSLPSPILEGQIGIVDVKDEMEQHLYYKLYVSIQRDSSLVWDELIKERAWTITERVEDSDQDPTTEPEFEGQTCYTYTVDEEIPTIKKGYVALNISGYLTWCEL